MMPPGITMSVSSKSTGRLACSHTSSAWAPEAASSTVIALDLEHLNHHLAQGLFIFGHEDGFAPGAQRGVHGRLRFLGWLLARRKIDAESGALIRFALHLQPALMLPDNAEDGGQAQAGAFAGGFGGEERFKDPVENFACPSRCRCR